MSGVLQILAASQRMNPLSAGATDHTLNPYGLGSYSGGGLVSDFRYFGYPAVGGGLSPTARDSYVIESAFESVTYASNDGSFVGATARSVYLTLSTGPAPLAEKDITSVACPSGPTLTTPTTFTSTSDGGTWRWDVAAGPDDTPTHMGAGTLTVTV